MSDHYPLPARGGDRRFTAGLLSDVASLLEAHGYPRPASGGDLIRWQQALFRTIYRTEHEESVLT